MKKETIQREDITLVNIYAPNICKYVQQILMVIVGETDRNTAIAGYLNNLLTSMDRSSRQKINKETAALNDTLDHMDLIATSEHFIPKQQNIHTFQVHMEHFLG